MRARRAGEKPAPAGSGVVRLCAKPLAGDPSVNNAALTKRASFITMHLTLRLHTVSSRAKRVSLVQRRLTVPLFARYDTAMAIRMVSPPRETRAPVHNSPLQI